MGRPYEIPEMQTQKVDDICAATRNQTWTNSIRADAVLGGKDERFSADEDVELLAPLAAAIKGEFDTTVLDRMAVFNLDEPTVWK
ncbi:hypothetical protein CYMTET_43411 [Cymbomonas tetramitiformis]|uniref:Uncharacterized protein n=1 Tax=Cymbomonas tetramitiformis TaxID=36881 RepID=A0AAE0C297_9CHLO|nr:hypothetical protein CYMTET_43414 [Cymbomonas tetramitiformis]KAK3247083.1 hypothetical protein CYMTET_43411 [Cymbomonas tetramitiformis]